MENLKLKKYFKTRTMVTIAIIASSLIFMGLISFISYSYFLKVSRDDLKMHLMTLVNMSVPQIDGDKHSIITSGEDVNSIAYEEFKKTLQDIRSSAKDIHNIYTMRENSNKEIIFTVLDSKYDAANIPSPGDIYYEASPLLKNNFSSLKDTIVENNFTTDRWGTWYSGYAPFYDKNGKMEGVLGIDIKASDVLAKERNIFLLYLIIFLMSGLLASLIGLRLNRIISTSVLSLSNMLKDEKNLKVFPSSDDEIGELKNMFENILDKTNESKISTQEQLIAKTKELEEINKHLSGDDKKISLLKKEINDLRELFFKK